MMQKRVEQMVINATDICNMECAFCLRGDGQGRKLDLNLIPRIFEGIDVINNLTISGGEPSCYIEAVTAVVDYLSEHKEDVHVNGFYIITNGKEYRQELVDAVKTMMFFYIERIYGEKETISGKDNICYDGIIEELSYSFGVSVSLDEFHEPINFINYMKYRTSGIYSTAKEYDYSKGGIIARGRGYSIPHSRDRYYEEFEVEQSDDDAIDVDMVYVTVEGQVFRDCDMSYEMEEHNEHAGDLQEETLAQIIQRHADDDQE